MRSSGLKPSGTRTSVTLRHQLLDQHRIKPAAYSRSAISLPSQIAADCSLHQDYGNDTVILSSSFFLRLLGCGGVVGACCTGETASRRYCCCSRWPAGTPLAFLSLFSFRMCLLNDACSANAYVLRIPAGVVRCFFENLEKDNKMSVSFEVASGGHLDIDFRVLHAFFFSIKVPFTPTIRLHSAFFPFFFAPSSPSLAPPSPAPPPSPSLSPTPPFVALSFPARSLSRWAVLSTPSRA